jgi:hypothetical protein
MTQLHPDTGGAYGSSSLANGPHTDGTCETQESAEHEGKVIMKEETVCINSRTIKGNSDGGIQMHTI